MTYRFLPPPTRSGVATTRSGVATTRPGVATTSWVAAVCLVATFALACKGNDPLPSPTAPEAVPRITENFTGSFGHLGVAFSSFTITLVGPTEITLVALAPLATLTVGMGVGTPLVGETTTCSLTAQDTSVRVGDTFLVSNLAAGTYCVAVFDVGNVFPGIEVTYSISVTHP